MTGTIRVFLVDDHEIVRTGLSWLIGSEPDMEIVGETASAEEATALLEDANADVLVLDYRLSGIDGLELCRELAERRDKAAVIIHSAFLDDATAWACLSAGARGYVVKDASSDELKQAIRKVAGGEMYLDSTVAGRMMVAGGSASRAKGVLSPAVKRVLKLAIEGNTNRDIAKLTNVSVHTVKSQLSTAYARLGVRDRTEAAAASIRLKLF